MRSPYLRKERRRPRNKEPLWPPTRARWWLLATMCGVMLVGMGPFIYRKYHPIPAFQGAGVVTVVSVVGGYEGKRWGNFDHRVRLESGIEATMAFREIFPPGTRVWVSYSHYPTTGWYRVRTYVRSGTR